MNKLIVLCFLLLTVAFSNANHWGCSVNVPCGLGRICHTLNSFCSCIEISRCLDVTLESKVIGSWETGGRRFTQYDVTIRNNLNVDIKNIYIGTDCTLALRDYDSLWNVNRLDNGELTLPAYQPSINKNAAYTFGFIIVGSLHPNMAILAVTY